MRTQFWILTGASALSKTGNSFLYVAVPLEILKITGSSFLAVLSLGIQSVPYIISPLLGSIIDKYDKRHLFTLSEVFQAFFVTLLPWFLKSGQLYTIFIILLAIGLGAIISNTITDYELIPSLVSLQKIDRDYSRYFAILQIARFIGPAIAGFLIASVGSSWTLWLDAITFLVTAIVAQFLTPATQPKSTKKIISLLREGIYFFRQRNDIKNLTLALTVFYLGIGSLFSLVVTVADSYWNWTAEFIGIALSGGAAASALGAWLTAYLPKAQKLEQRISFWLGVCVAGSVAFLLTTSIGGLIGYYIVSFGQGGVNVTTVTYRHKMIEVEYSGRVNAIVRMFVMGATSLSSVILGCFSNFSNSILQFIPVIVASFAAFLIWRRWMFVQSFESPL